MYNKNETYSVTTQLKAIELHVQVHAVLEVTQNIWMLKFY